MSKTVYLDNYYGLEFGSAVNTTVVAAEHISGGSYYDDNGVLQQNPPIGVQVYPASLAGIAANVTLMIGGGIGQVLVTGTGSDSGGAYFTYGEDSEPLPEAGASVQTPWLSAGALLYALASGNSVALSYYSPVEHDLYFRTQQSSDSGSITATLDGSSLGAPISLVSSATVLAEVLLRAGVASGNHTVVVTASIAGAAVFVYFNGFDVLEHAPETGGEYLYLGPTGTLDDSANNFAGNWATIGSGNTGFAYNSAGAGSVFFYPQLGAGGKIAFRAQRTPDSGIIAVYVNGTFQQNLDLYASPAVALAELTLLDTAAGAAPGQYSIELRATGTKNPSSTGLLFYFRSSVVYFSRTDSQALELAAAYLKQVAAIRGDGAFLDAYDSTRINFDATALYACMGLLAASQALSDASCLTPVKNFLVWFASMQLSNPGVEFDDGSWKIGYQVNPAGGSPAYIPAIAPYDAQGISEIRWVDAVQCLPAFILWWYWTLSGDNATRDALLPAFAKGIDGFIANNYDGATGFFFSSWQNKTSATVFLYHNAVLRTDSGGNQLDLEPDSDTGFFTYVGAWSSYAPVGAIGNGEHYTLESGDYVQFSLALNAGDHVHWITQTAFDAGIADILKSSDGVAFTQVGTVDAYTADIELQRDFLIYTAPAAGTVYFRIKHSGTINSAGNSAPGWTRVASRYSAGQSDILLGLMSLWLLTRNVKYSTLAARIVERFPGAYWSQGAGRWLISLDGPAPCAPNSAWYPQTHGYTPFAQGQSRLFQPTSLLAAGLAALEPYQDSDGGFTPPGFAESERIFEAFYLLGENQLQAPTNSSAYALADASLKGGQFFVTVGGVSCGGITFSKRYPYLYTNISGFACLALAGAVCPFTEQLQTSVSRVLSGR